MTLTQSGQTMSSWGTESHLNELEASMWRAERHPTHSLQGAILQVLDREPRWKTVVAIHQESIRRFPRFRQRVAEPAVPVTAPVWVDDERFDLGYHLRRIRLPDPGGFGELLEVAASLAVTPLARNRALWCATLIEGLEGGRAAYFLSVHHCLMDGNAVMQLFGLLNQGADAAPAALAPTEPPHPTAGPLRLAARGAIDTLRHAPRTGASLLRSTRRVVTSNPMETVRFVQSVGRVLAPVDAAPSEAYNVGTRSTWAYGAISLEFNDLRAAAKAGDGSLNDAYLAAILGGLRIYNETEGLPVAEVPVNMPVSVRRPGEEGGNRFSAAFLSGPADEPDPARRIARLREAVTAIRAEPALDFFSLLLPLVNRAPASIMTPLFTSIQDRADLTVSNVVGPPQRLPLAGAEIEAMYCFGPLPGTPVTSVLCSYNGRIYVTVTCDAGAFAEPQTLFASIAKGFAEVLALAGPEHTRSLTLA